MAEERQIGIPQEPLDYSSDLTTKPYELDENKKYDDQKHEVISGEIKRTVIGDNWRIPMQFNERQNQLGQVVAGLQDTVDIDSFMAKEYIKWRTDPAGAASGFVAGATLMGTPGLNIAVGGGALLMAAEKSFPETFGALKPEQSKDLTRSGLEDIWNKEIEKESQKLSKAKEDLDSGKISQLQFDAMQRNFDNLIARRQTNLEKVDKFNATVKALDGVSYPNKKVADASVVAAARFLEMRELNKSIEMAQKGIDPESTGYKVANLAGSAAILAGTALGANYLARYGLSNTLKRITTDVETTGGAARLATIKPVRSRREAAEIGKSAVELTTAEMESAQYTWENIKDYIERTGDKTLSEFNPQDLHAFMGSAYGAIAGKIETMGGIENIAAGGMRRLGIGGFWHRVLTTGGEEAVEEGAQSLTEFLSRKIDNTTDKTFGEALEDALNSAAWSGFMGLGFGTIGGVTYRNARKQGVKVLQEYGLSRDTAEKVFDNMVDQVSDANSPQNETVRDKVREKVATIYENADLSPVELEDTIESITDLEMAFIAYDSAENGIDIADNPILQGEVNQIGWFREGIPEQVADQVRTLNDEITGLRQQLKEENAKETKDFNKIDDLEAKIEQFYAKLPKEISDIVETDRAKVRQMLDEQMARARDLQDRRKVVRQVQQRALKALQREQESDVQKSLRRLQEQTRTEEQKARAEERKQWQEQRKLRKAIEKLRIELARRKSNLPASQEMFADADLAYQALLDSGFTNQEISTMSIDNIVREMLPYGISPVSELTTRKGAPKIADGSTVIKPVVIEDAPNFKKRSELRNWLIERFNAIKSVVIESTGNKVDFSKSGAKRAVKNSRKSENNLAYKNIEEVVKRAQYSGFRPTDTEHPNVIGQDVYHSAIIVNNTPYSVEFYVDQPISPEANKNFAGNKVKEIKIEPAAIRGDSVAQTGSISGISLAVLRGDVKQARQKNGILRQTKPTGKGADTTRGFYIPEYRLVVLAQQADPTTLAHELAHDWMQQFFRHYRSGRASESFMKSWGAVEKALGITENDITVPDKASEAFARAYEAWILNNKDWAKNIDIEDKDRDELVKMFEQYQGYLTDVYEDLNNPYFLETWGETGKLKPELQAWFDKVTNPTDLIDAQVQTGAITPEQAQTKQITRTVNEVVQAAENNFTQEEKDEINAVERMNDTSRYEVKGGNKNSLQNRLSGLARDIDANNIALKRYDTHRDMLEVAKAADDFVRTRRDEALDIINGIAPETEGLYASDLYTALERVALENNDVDLAMDLVNSKVAQDLAKQWGQRIAGFRNFTGDGDFDVVSQLKSLDNKFKKDYDEKGKQRVETAANEYVEELNKADDSQDVDAFLETIKCQ